MTLRTALLALALLLPGVSPLNAVQMAVIADLRVHGNHTTPDADVLRIAGLAVGAPADPVLLEQARLRLEQSGRFETVEIRTRYRSLTDTSQVSIVVLISEDALVSVTDAGDVVLPGPIARLRRSTMFLPMFGFEDGYGLTYGVRFTVVGARQSATRVSMPLSWGGTRQAAVEASHTFTGGPVTRVSGRVGITRREHPFFRQGETRREVAAEVLKRFGPVFGVGLAGARTDVRFGELRGDLDSLGAFVEIDTRRDPHYPRNAVYLRSGVGRLWLDPAPGAVRATHEARGYLGLPRGAVLALRAQTTQADGPVPTYAKAMVGGAASLRGWRAGSAVGDNMAAGSAELRVPISSPVSLAHTGVAVFYDVGTVWDHGVRFRDQRLERGVGVGFFVAAPLFALQLDVAKGIDRGTRVHLSLGTSF
jgi:outer membrane protein assembly factor BamA